MKNPHSGYQFCLDFTSDDLLSLPLLAGYLFLCLAAKCVNDKLCMS
jgi:hypothetical protein